MSKLLREFLQAYVEWVGAGAIDHCPFDRCVGLCSNLARWLIGVGASYEQMDREAEQLKDMFVADGLDYEYPFGGDAAYWDEGESEAMHLNPARIAWVRSKVKQHEVA